MSLVPYSPQQVSQVFLNPHVLNPEISIPNWDHGYKIARAEAFFASFTQMPSSVSLEQKVLTALSEALIMAHKHQSAFVRATTKTDSYFTRLFSSETWEEWVEDRTPLGKVERVFANAVHGYRELDHYLKDLDEETLLQAATEAHELPSKWSENSPKITRENSYWNSIVSTLTRIDRAMMFPGADAFNLGKKLRKAGESLGGAVSDAGKSISEAPKKAKKAVDKAVKDVKAEGGRAAEKVKEAPKKAKKAVDKAVKDVKAEGGRAAEKVKEAPKKVEKAVDKAVKDVKAEGGRAAEKVKEIPKKIDKRVIKAKKDINKATDNLKKGRDEVIDKMHSGMRDAAEKVESVIEDPSKLVKEVNKGLKTIDKERVKAFNQAHGGIVRLGENIQGGIGNIIKLATGEIKINPKSIEKAWKKARQDWKEEMQRAPKPIQMVDTAFKVMIEQDPEGTAILLASFIADAYAPGTGQFIRQGYLAHNLAKSGKGPDQIIEQLAKGNVEQILKTAVEVAAPEYSAAVNSVIETKKAYDTYKNNEDIIRGALNGEGRAQALLGQLLIVQHEALAEQFEQYGFKGEDLVRLNAGDQEAAKNLLSSAMKLSVEATVKNVNSAIEEDLKEELILAAEKEDETPSPESSLKEQDAQAHKQDSSKTTLEEPKIIDPADCEGDFTSKNGPHIESAPHEVKGPKPTETDAEKIYKNAGDQFLANRRDDALEAAIEKSEENAGKRVKQKVKKADIEAVKEGKEAGRTRKENKPYRKDAKDIARDKALKENKAIKAGKKLAGKVATKAADYAKDPESTVIETAAEAVAKIIDAATKSGGKLASKAAVPITVITELFSSGELNEESFEETYKSLGFKSADEYWQWVDQQNTHQK